MKRAVFSIVLTLILTSMLPLAFNIQPIKASGTIYIRANGSVDPPTAPMATPDNLTYFLTDSINDSIIVERNNITIDGNGYRLLGSGSGVGISNGQVMDYTNLTIDNVQIQGFSFGISLLGIMGISCSVAQSNITNIGVGIKVMSMHTKFNFTANNIVNNSDVGIYLGDCQGHISGNSIMNNGGDGIYAMEAACFISENNVTGNGGNGIDLPNGVGGEILENNVTDNKGSGIILGAGNRIIHNLFKTNGNQVSTSSINTWDNGYPYGGNYWSDYNGTDLSSGSYQNETGSDNIGDSPYVIDANNQDNYPLIRPYVPFENQTVYIRADGSIDPSGAPILRKGDLYTLAGNIASNTNGIVIERDGITLDRAEYTLQGPGIGTGIELNDRMNVTIQNMQIMTFDYGIGLGFSSLNTISNNKVTTCHCGIDLGFSSGNIISGNTVTDTLGYASIHLVNSASNSIFGNNVTANWGDGILLYSSSNNLISGNNLSANGNIGIELSGSSYPFGSYCNTISGNDASFNNWTGISISHSSNDSIFENNIAANSAYGISLWSSSDNVIFHNNFENNTQQADIDPASMNTWDNGYPIGGNYWSDYNGTDFYCGPCQNETGSDGIGDTTYNIDSTNVDNYPLMNTWSPPDIAIANLATLKTVIGQGYTGTVNVTLENQGNKIEAFNTSIYANSTVIYSESIMLAMINQTLSFKWNTTGFAYGNYTINACAEPLLEELDISDNNCTCSFTVHVGVPGDISGHTQGVYDGMCNMRDIQYLILRFNTNPSSPNWNPNADIDNDGTVNMRDIQIAILNFNKHE